MLANLCASKVFSLSTRRGYTSAASERPVTFWNHAYAANKAPFEQAPTESSHGVSGALIEKMRRLRHEAPHTFTAKRLSRNFNLSRTTINRVAPYEAPGAAMTRKLKAERLANKVVEDPQVKKQRLAEWWHKQIRIIPVLKARRHLYKIRASRCMEEVDLKLMKESDTRDYHADIIAETARNKKRKAMAANRRKK